MALPNVDPGPPDAQEELNSLIQTLHEQGLLRLANDLAASHAQWMPALSEIVDESADFEQLRSAIPAVVETAGLLNALHQQGLLRFANDAVSSRAQWAPALGDILDDSVDIEQLRNAIPAFVEISGLAQTLHEQGLLRFVNDMAVSHAQLMQTLGEILDDYLNDDRNRRVLQNLSVAFTTTLSRIEPNQLGKLLLALGDSLEYIAAHKPGKDETMAPGLMGVYRLIKDESLWRTLTPIIEALKVFGAELGKEADQSPKSSSSDGQSTRT
jgi:uncharacterized protein YjgD (DUF1641 family)